MSLMSEQFEFLKDVSKLIQFIEKYCAETPEDDSASAGEMFRPQRMQDYYVSVGLSRTSSSKHTQRLAIDINFIEEGKLIEMPEPIGEYWESLSPKNVWGGRWKSPYDPGHFERRI